MRRTTVVLLIAAAAIVVGGSAMQGVAFAQKDSSPKRWDKVALGERDAAQLALLIDTDQNGKIINRMVTRQEWLAFMEAEFDRLDKNKSGEIDPAELARSMPVSRIVTGK
jgi:hypothetical protein